MKNDFDYERRNELEREMKAAYRNHKLEAINIRNIESLKGKHIQILNFGYIGQNNVDDFTVGEVISCYELASREVMSDGRTRAEYWESYMTEEELQKGKDRLNILADYGWNTFIYYDKEMCPDGNFYMGDIDRRVYYRVID